MPGFEVWISPGGLVWEGTDQEEAFLAGFAERRPGVVVEVAEIYNMLGDLHLRRLSYYDGRHVIRIPGEP